MKKNQVFLLYWLFFFATVNGSIGRDMGYHYLFLDPEYLGSVNFLSFMIMGLCLGVFIICFYITSYILDAHRYKFLVQLKHPFIGFSLNNSFFPVTFVVFYIYKLCNFQHSQGLESFTQIIGQIIGLLLGMGLIIGLVFMYFNKTNRSGLVDIIESIDKSLKRRRSTSQKMLYKVLDARANQYKIKSFLNKPWKIKQVNNRLNFNSSLITKIFDQNHLNAVFVEFIIFIIIMSLGFYKDFTVFKIPAGASAFLFFSFLMMFTGAFFYWLRAWALSIVIILLLSLNFFMQEGYIKSKYEAFGINYNTETVPYNKKALNDINSLEAFELDKNNTINILNNWRNKFGKEKPKMVLITSSGGGQRSAVWSTNVLQAIDKTRKESILKNTTLITGASGGVIGSSYYRELYLRSLNNETDLLDPEHIDNISKDILNPMIFSMLVSDLFLRYQTFEYKNQTHYKGRGYAFETTLNNNIGGILNKSLEEYKDDEYSAKIPMVILAPTITNDARKLYISPQKVSYLNRTYTDVHFRSRGIGFMSTFEKQNAKDLHFLSALRMSATFPYITPNIHLPTSPEIEIMDAGLSDNFGISDALKYMSVFQKWINENTSGIVLISIRDKEKDPEIKEEGNASMIDKTLNPIGVLYKNWDFVQDRSNDFLFEILSKQFKVPVDKVIFEYNPKEQLEDRASLSWHLTMKEKESIKTNITDSLNQSALKQILDLVK